MPKKALAVMALVLAISAAGCVSAMRTYKKSPSLPAYEGKLRVAGLEGEVQVYRDEFGVPHILTENEHDLMFAAGYVHAQDRLFEIVFLRALATGRTSELLGNVGLSRVEVMGYPLSTLAIDLRQRTLGMKYLGEIGAALLQEENPTEYRQLQSYCDGVNAFLAAHPSWKSLPLEFQLLRARPEPLTVADILGFSRFLASMLCSNLPVELSRYIAIKEFGPEAGWELAPLYGNQGPTIVPPALLKNKLAHPRDLPPGGRPPLEEMGYSLSLSSQEASRVLLAEKAFNRALRIDEAFGSNNWVVSGKLTESGNPILANDPHLNHFQPSLFYLMHLQGAGYDAMGATFPGSPFVILGHSRRLAWGATTSRADVQDLYLETTDPDHAGMYKYQGQWRPFFIREETIKVRTAWGMTEKKVKIRHSIHGPILNDSMAGLKQVPPLALRWTGWDYSRDPRLFELIVSSSSVEDFMAKYRALPKKPALVNICLSSNLLMKGSSLRDFTQAMELLDVPNANWIAADADGHIAYLPGGLAPIRKKGLGVMPAPGESGDFDWVGFIPTLELPHAIDPERGWMATANNEVVDAEWYPYLFSTTFGEPWRAMRIEQLIQELKPLSMEDMKRIQNDVYVKRAEWEMPFILRAVQNKNPSDPLVLKAVNELKQWDFESDVDSTATVIFFQFLKELWANVMEDEADPKIIKALKLEGYPDLALNLMLERGQSRFFDDQRTKDLVEDMDDMIIRSLADAMSWVIKKYGEDPSGWKWGGLHYLKWYHPLALAGEYRNLSVGPYPLSGADQTVKMAKGAGFGRDPYKSIMGPCFRHLMDLGDPDGSLLVIDGSQSGQYLSPHYSDLHQLFVRGEYLVGPMSPEAVRKSAKYHQTLSPGPRGEVSERRTQ